LSTTKSYRRGSPQARRRAIACKLRPPTIVPVNPSSKDSRVFFSLTPDGDTIAILRSSSVVDPWAIPTAGPMLDLPGRNRPYPGERSRPQGRNIPHHDCFASADGVINGCWNSRVVARDPASVAADMALGAFLGQSAATVVHLLEATLHRIGNEDYAKQIKAMAYDPSATVKGRIVRVGKPLFRSSARAERAGLWGARVRICASPKSFGRAPIAWTRIGCNIGTEGAFMPVASSGVNAYWAGDQKPMSPRRFQHLGRNRLGGARPVELAEYPVSGPGQEKPPRRHRLFAPASSYA